MADRQLASLLELDPDLGQLLDEETAELARRDLRVAVHVIPAGPWNADRLSGASPEHLGLLVVDGVIGREVLVSDTVSTELLGPGDVVRPWRLAGDSALLQHQIRWNVLTRSRVALLDKRFGHQVARFPEVNAALVDRVNERALRLAVTQAISQLNRVDRRLLALFWHLAERWGRMTRDGVTVPMTLSHRMLGQLIGARRPTVSTALGQLAKQNELVRRDDGTWLLRGAPVGLPQPELERVVPLRRRLLPPEPAAVQAPPAAEVVPMSAADVHPDPEPVHVAGVELRAVLQNLRAECELHVQAMRGAYSEAARLTERTSELRLRCRATRESSRNVRRVVPRERPALPA